MTSLEQTPAGPAVDPAENVLDEAAWAALHGPQAHFARGNALVARYPPDVSPFVAPAPGVSGPELWSAIYDLVGPGQVFGLFAPESTLDSMPAGWQLPLRGVGVQMVATDALQTAAAPEAVVLGAADVPEMLDLVGRTKPGPFMPRTYLMGTYLGLRRDGALVAMAGERLHPPGYTEISAVCTDPAFRGQGLAARLIRAVAQGIRARGETPMLHSAADNHTAIRLYQQLGFRIRRHVGFFAVQTPGAAADAETAATANPETVAGLHSGTGPA